MGDSKQKVLDFVFDTTANKAYIDFNMLFDFLNDCLENAKEGVLFPKEFEGEQDAITTINFVSSLLAKMYMECFQTFLEENGFLEEKE